MDTPNMNDTVKSNGVESNSAPLDSVNSDVANLLDNNVATHICHFEWIPERSDVEDAGRLRLVPGRLPIPDSEKERAREHASRKLPSGHTWKEALGVIKSVVAAIDDAYDITEAEREDLIQEGRIAVWQGDADAQHGGAQGWDRFLATRLHGRLSDALRAMRSDGITESLEDLADTLEDPTPTAAEVAELESVLEAARAAFDPTEWDLLAAYYGVDGRAEATVRELAGLFDISKSEVQRRIQASIALLHSNLGQGDRK